MRAHVEVSVLIGLAVILNHPNPEPLNFVLVSCETMP